MVRNEGPTTPAAQPPWDRRLFHLFAGSVIPLTGFFLGWGQAVTLAATSSAILVLLEVARLRSPRVNRWFIEWLGILLKPNEERAVTAATYLALASLAAFLAFDVIIAGLALLYLALGDPAAAVVGSRYGRRRWFAIPGAGPRARTGKSLEGSLAFVVVCMALALLLWNKGALAAYWPAAVSAVVAAIVEFLPLPVDDNLSVPLIAGAVMTALWTL